MPHIVEVDSLDHPGLAPFAHLTEAQLRNRLTPSEGLFIAESPKVILTALHTGLKPIALLCEHRRLALDAAQVMALCPESMPVYTGSRELLANLTGYTLTRGVLCAMRRPEEPSLADICRNARRLAVLQGVTDTTNIGAIFRSAAALGVDGILLTPDTCDPLNRRAVRVSMGTVFLVPWAYLHQETHHALHEQGFRTAAMALTPHSVTLDSPVLRKEERLAVVLGTEGDGLPHEAIEGADYVVRIPMHHSVDSLNVAAASAVAFWELRPRE